MNTRGLLDQLLKSGQEMLHGDVSCRYQGIVLRGFAGWLRAFLCFLYQFRTSFNPGL